MKWGESVAVGMEWYGRGVGCHSTDATIKLGFNTMIASCEDQQWVWSHERSLLSKGAYGAIKKQKGKKKDCYLHPLSSPMCLFPGGGMETWGARECLSVQPAVAQKECYPT
jgi:hypothetical protein